MRAFERPDEDRFCPGSGLSPFANIRGSRGIAAGAELLRRVAEWPTRHKVIQAQPDVRVHWGIRICKCLDEVAPYQFSVGTFSR
jgi:hypothetical protein